MRGRGPMLAAATALLGAIALGGSAHAAATWTVTTTSDATGSCLPSSCSLREAVGAAASGDTVVLPAASTAYFLSGGALSITRSIAIEGAGARSTTIAGSGSHAALVISDSAAGAVTVSGVTISNGIDSSSNGGGGIQLDTGTLDLDDDAITGDSENGPGGGGAALGGGIAISAGATLNADRDVFAGDDASASGLDDDAFGGAIDNNGTATIEDTTIAGDEASYSGGGSAAAFGGGIANGGAGQLTLVNDTFAGNTAGGANGAGGDLYTSSSGATDLRNTIVAEGTATNDPSCDAGAGAGFTSQGDNIDAASDECAIGGASGDRNATDPKLGTFAYHGGPTQTVALLAGSPALRATSGCPAEDQRGEPRGTSCSIGALEPQPPTLSVIASALSVTPGSAVSFTAAAGESDPTDTVAVSWSFSDGTSASGTSATRTLTAPGSYTATATATEALGLTTSESVSVTVLGPPALSGAALRLHQPARRHGKRHARKFSAALSFTLSEQASVAATISERLRGRRVHGRCEAPRASASASCPKTRQVEQFTLSSAAGANSLTFPGSAAPTRLRAGHYTLTLIATGAGAQQSAPLTLTFTVKR
ncbi:MAG TPA: choice-of-anchor Q domain-containing protein [Solirubrobacteraceae bacterium]|nr:choice-of-anchor Q domain-containing protein [Solirubrobacteraceae bacterium]